MITGSPLAVRRVVPTTALGRTRRRPPDDRTGPPIELTKREVSVLSMVANGYSNKTIGRKLSLSEHTIKRHISNILRALQARDRTHAVAKGFAAGTLTSADIEGVPSKAAR